MNTIAVCVYVVDQDETAAKRNENCLYIPVDWRKLCPNCAAKVDKEKSTVKRLAASWFGGDDE